MTFLKLTKNVLYTLCIVCVLLLLATASLSDQISFTPLGAVAAGAALWTRWSIGTAWRLAGKESLKYYLASALLCLTALVGASTTTMATLEYSGLVRVERSTLSQVAELPLVQNVQRVWEGARA